MVADAKRFTPDLVVIDTSFTGLRNDISITKAIKGCVGETEAVLVGLPHLQFAEKMLANDGVDAVARFEYEFTLRDIAQAVEDGRGFMQSACQTVT